MTENGFLKGQSDNLPKIDSIMVYSFFTKNTDYVSAEIRGVKASSSSRENYGDNAVGYVQVKRDRSVCTVKARITPEHKVRAKPYTVTLTCDEKDGVVESCICEDCPASQGGCKHAIAFLHWVHRRSEDPPKTSVQCYWKKSKMAEIGTELKFITCADLSRRPNTSVFTPSGVLPAIVAKTKDLHKKSESIIMNYFNDATNIDTLSIHYLMEMFINSDIGTDADDFISFCRGTIDAESCKEVAELTVNQTDCNIWYEMRYGRITASKLHEAANCKTLDGTLVECLLGAKIKDTEAMKRGRMLEGEILKKLKKNKRDIRRCGLMLCNKFPLFGASPDGICEEYVIEIKCPKICNWKQKYFTGNSPSAKFMAQMQLQMLLSQKKRGLYCVASPQFEETGEVIEMYVDLDEQFCYKLIEQATIFWKKAVFVKLFS